MDNKNEQEFVNLMITEWIASDKYKIAKTAKQYYKNKNDIVNKTRYSIINGEKTVNNQVENNIISHPIFRDLVDQKINYLLGNDWNVGNEELSNLFDDDFRLTTQLIATDAIMCGIGWGFALPNNKFKYIDALNIIPIWVDGTHDELKAVINLYIKYDYTQGTKKEVEYAELWSNNGISVYKKNADKYIFMESKSQLNNGITGENWLKLPFLPIKYNQDELSLLELVKPLIDKMDKTASDTQDLLSDLTNKTRIFTGIGGTSPRDIAVNSQMYRVIILPEGGDCKEIGTEPDITASTTWIDHLRNQIYIAGRGYDPLQAIGANASGDARRNLYTSLDLDVNQLEIGVLKFLKKCIWFINGSPNTNYNIPIDVKIKFTRNMLINQSEQIENAVKAQGVDGLSKETIIGMTGLVENVTAEIKKAEKESEENMAKQNNIYNDMYKNNLG